MKNQWSRFWWNYEDEVILTVSWVTGLVLLFVFIVCGIGFVSGQQDQYNCQLSHRPSIKTEILLNHDPYGYDPEGFCKKLKERMKQK